MKYIPCENYGDCPQSEYVRGCYEDVHHEYYPKARYKSGVERTYRNLEENKVLVCRDVHVEIHKGLDPPEMPSMDVMWQAIHNAKRNREIPGV